MQARQLVLRKYPGRTMLSSKVFPSGLNGQSVTAICNDVASGLTATGTLQSDAYALTYAVNEFTTVASGTGAKLPVAVPGDSVKVYAGGANNLKVYPPSGGSINNGATDAAFTISANTGNEFTLISATRWMSD